MDKYEVVGEIGKGCFGRVSKIIRKTDNQILIWKELNYEGIPDKEQQLIENEINILKEMNHPNIVNQYEIIKDERNSKLYIVMEYCDGEDLEKLILKYKLMKRYLNEEFIWDILFQALIALNYIHNEKKILHRDIKPNNIFLDKDWNVKLGDFGLSKKFLSEYSNTIIGTPIYMSPELLERKPYNVKTDIWALGCSIYELATFSTPYEAPNMNILLNKIRNGLPQRIDKTYSDELWNIISKMLTYDYNKRPSSLQLIDDCCRIFVLKNRFKSDYYYQKKWEELCSIKQQLDKKQIEQQKKDEDQRKKEKMIDNREYSVKIFEEKLKIKEQELNKEKKELEEKYKKFIEEKKKELKEIQKEKEKKMKEFNNQEIINKNQENLSLNNKQSYLNNVDNNKSNLLINEVNLKDGNNNFNYEYNNSINKNNSNYNISNNQNNFNYEENKDELFFTKQNLEKFLKDKKKKNTQDFNALDLLNNY